MKNGHLSSWAKNVAPSPTLAVDAKAKALKAAAELHDWPSQINKAKDRLC